jgi:hypothetical protein
MHFPLQGVIFEWFIEMPKHLYVPAKRARNTADMSIEYLRAWEVEEFGHHGKTCVL